MGQALRCTEPVHGIELFNIPAARLTDFVEYDPSVAIKFSIAREQPSGSPGEPNIFGAQQYAPLMDIEVPMV